MNQRTPLFDAHVAAGARLVPFAGWDMPLHYGSQLEEHRAVRTQAGMFDVSHMTVTDVGGTDAANFLARMFANDVGKLSTPGRALYGVLLNERAGIVDDLIVYRRQDGYRVVSNAGTRGAVTAWLTRWAESFEVSLNVRDDVAMIAVQGPDAVGRFEAASGIGGIDALAAFETLEHDERMVARTGYTGEDGVEIVLPAAQAPPLWTALVEAGVRPAGLGARDTLRAEAGLNLYGQDMTEDNHPLECNLGWTIAWQPEERDFVGRARLAGIRAAGPERKLTGLVLEGKGVMRHDTPVFTDAGSGVVTSGIFAPTLGYSIALARLPRAAKGQCEVEIRGKRIAARIVRPPFVRHGRKAFD